MHLLRSLLVVARSSTMFGSPLTAQAPLRGRKSDFGFDARPIQSRCQEEWTEGRQNQQDLDVSIEDSRRFKNQPCFPNDFKHRI
jgi:hypothetical protein